MALPINIEDLTEGRATGIPSIQKSLKENGSSNATIETDDDRTYFLMTIPCHQDMVNTPSLATIGNIHQELDERLGQILGQTSVQVWDKSKIRTNKLWLVKNLIDAICILKKEDVSAQQLNQTLSFGDIKDLKRKIINPLIHLGYVAMTNPNKPTSSKQKYTLTDLGRKLFE